MAASGDRMQHGRGGLSPLRMLALMFLAMLSAGTPAQADPTADARSAIEQVVRGFFAYHAVPLNGPVLSAFRYHVTDLWRRTLRRRSQKDARVWQRIEQLANHWLPKPIIRHPWPDSRFRRKHPRWETYALIGPVRICAGGGQQ